MAIAIEATGVSLDPGIQSSIAHAAAAARACLAEAGVSADTVDLLINVGVYRDANMVEPAMAALIQKEIGFRLDFPNPTMRSAFSFDVMNGACGVLNAVQVASAFLTTGKVTRVLVVSSDAHPSNRPAPGFPYATMGAAMLLVKSGAPTRGFGAVRLGASRDDFAGVSGSVTCGEGNPGGAGRIDIVTHPEYGARLVELAASEVHAYVAEHRLDLGRTALVTTQPTPTFGRALAARLELDPAAVVRVTGVEGDPHSSALTLGYRQATARGLAANVEQLLFVGAGSGLATACAVYHPVAS